MRWDAQSVTFFNFSNREIIAENANLNPDEDESDENKTFQDDILDHTTLTATSTQRTTQHAIGVVHDGSAIQ